MTFSKLWAPAIVLLAIGFTAGCGGGSSGFTSQPPQPAAKPEFLYAKIIQGIGSSPSGTLAIFKVDPSTGALTSNGTLSLPSFTSAFAVNAKANTLYVSDEQPNASLIDIYHINPDSGAVTQANSLFLSSTICPFCPPPPNGPGPLLMDPMGKFLYYGSDQFGSVTESVGSLSVDGNGALAPVSGSPFAADSVPYVLAVHPQGKFIFTENMPNVLGNAFQIQSISGFSVGTNGGLTPTPHSPLVPSGPVDLGSFTVHPSGKFLYATSASSTTGLSAWAINQTTGEISDLPGFPFLSGVHTAIATFDRTGKFLYLTFGIENGFSVFTIDANTGIPTVVNGSPFSNGTDYSSTAIDPSGKFLFAADPHGTITTFKLDAVTGVPTAVGNPLQVNGQPLNLVSFELQ